MAAGRARGVLGRLGAPLRGLGRERLAFLGIVTGGHTVIHWFQQIFAVVLPSVTQGLGLSEIQTGYLQSARQLASGTMNLPVGLLADSFARLRATLLASALLCMGAGYFALGTARGLGGALLGAALIGLGTAAWHPPAMGALSARFPERRATALSIHGVGATVADTLTPLAVGGLLVAFVWHGFLRAQLLPAALAALVLWLGLARQFRSATGRPSRRALAGDVRAILVHPAFLAVSVAEGFLSMGRQVILTFFPLYIQIGLGRDAVELGLYVALLHGMGTLSQPVLGVLSDRLGRKAVLVPSFVLLGALYALLAWVRPGWPLGVLVLAIGLFFYTLVNITTAAVLDVAGPRLQASATGLATLMVQVLVLPAPVLAGWLVHRHGYGAAFALAAGFMAAALLALLPVRLYGGFDRTPA
jgi:FSR family fosmidomycin resistance protein-like MFS transporter